MKKAKELIDKEVYVFEIYKNDELILSVDAFNNISNGILTIDIKETRTKDWCEFCKEHNVWNDFCSKFLIGGDELAGITNEAIAYFGLTDNGLEGDED